MTSLHRQHQNDSRRLLFERAADTATFGVIDPFDEERFWHRHFRTEPHHDPRMAYEDYAPAYRLGVFHRLGMGSHRTCQECEAELQALWGHYQGSSRLEWIHALDAIRAAWGRVDKALAWNDGPHWRLRAFS